MANNLLRTRKNGEKLFIYDNIQTSDAFKGLVTNGAIPAQTLKELVRNCDVIISMVPASRHVRDLYLNSIIPSLRKKSLLVDCSTIDPGIARVVHAAAAADSHIMLDAPVSGGVKGAEAGTLTFMIGSSLSKSDFETHLKSLFEPMGKAIYCGGPGVGQAVKISNNLILGAQMLGVAEGYKLAKVLGVDMKTFNEIVNSSTGQCWTTSKYNPVPGVMEGVPASKDYQGGFMTDLMIKDLGLALDAAAQERVELPVAKFSHSQYKEASSGGFGNLDFGSIFKWFTQKHYS